MESLITTKQYERCEINRCVMLWRVWRMADDGGERERFRVERFRRVHQVMSVVDNFNDKNDDDR